MGKRQFPFASIVVMAMSLAVTATAQIASDPIPADGSEIDQTWAALGWTAGAGAVSHNVYFGDNRADVEDGTGGTFRGTQDTTTFLVGFAETPEPDGLALGTTYYWRIDEIEADVTARRGQIWRFTVIGPKARTPNPPDGGRFVDVDVELRWSPGLGAVMHHVYFGDNAADVEAGTGDMDKGLVAVPAYTPGPLMAGKTYYWRIDEVEADLVTTHTGDL